MALRSNSPALRLAGVIAMLAVLVVILYESSQARGQPGILDLTTNESYVGHFVIYGLVSFFAMLAIGRPTFGNFVAVFLMACALGAALELYQKYEPTRTASPQDAFADVAGAFSGLVAYGVLVLLLDSPRRLSTKS